MMLLAKATKWEGDAIDKLEKLTKLVSKLNDYVKCVAGLEKDKE